MGLLEKTHLYLCSFAFLFISTVSRISKFVSHVFFFLENIQDRNIKHNVGMGNAMLYRGIEIWDACSSKSLYLSIFLSLHFSNIINAFHGFLRIIQARNFKFGAMLGSELLSRQSDCWLMCLFLFAFSFSPVFRHWKMMSWCFFLELFNLQPWNVKLRTMRWRIVRQRIEMKAYTTPCIDPFFFTVFRH